LSCYFVIAGHIFAPMKNILIAVSLLLVLVSLAVGSDSMRCAGCGKEITEGKWIEAEGLFFHSNHFLCDNCKKPLKTLHYFTNNGLRYDSACYFATIAKRCAYCNEPIASEYIIQDGKNYHKRCYDEHIALHCSVCGEVIEGPFLYDQWGNSYHQSHEHEPRCRYCGRLVTASSEGGETYGDGRTVCGLCLKTAVKTPDEAT